MAARRVAAAGRYRAALRDGRHRAPAPARAHLRRSLRPEVHRGATTSGSAPRSRSATSSSSRWASSTAASSRRSPSRSPRLATAMAVSARGPQPRRGCPTRRRFLRPIMSGHGPRRGAPPPPRPDDLGVGGRDHRRRGPPVRAGADDDRGAGDHAALDLPAAWSPLRGLTCAARHRGVSSCGELCVCGVRCGGRRVRGRARRILAQRAHPRGAPRTVPLGDAHRRGCRARFTSDDDPSGERPRRAATQEPALGVDDLARDPAGLVRAQPGHERGGVLGAAEAAHREAREQLGAGRRRSSRCRSGRGRRR